MRSVVRRRIVFCFLLWSLGCHSQPPGWQNLDLQSDRVFGISTERAYKELLSGKIPRRVVVAVIDIGAVDVRHEDLTSVIWGGPAVVSPIRRSGVSNPYDKDSRGAFFWGDEEEIPMGPWMSAKMKVFYDSLSFASVPIDFRDGYRLYRKLLRGYKSEQQQANQMADKLLHLKNAIVSIQHSMGKVQPSVEDLRSYHPSDSTEQTSLLYINDALRQYPSLLSFVQGVDSLLRFFKSEEVDRFFGFDGARPNRAKFYGNLATAKAIFGEDDPSQPFFAHGTHIAGIIGGVRGNGLGGDGIANKVAIMPLQIVAGTTDWEAAVAEAVRYAADMGASIINLSINLGYGGGTDTASLRAAFQYAMSKDVLLVHASGNEGEELLHVGDGGGPGWIEVGASGPSDDSMLVARFSNYGKKALDVFAPGVSIYSTLPGNRYGERSGTSMAAPVVAGLAALIREYYPGLKASQVKQIILNSAVKVTHSVKVNGNIFPFSELSVSGGVVNAYCALKLAAAY